MRGCSFRDTLPINVQNYNGTKIQFFWRETFKIYDKLQSRTWSIHSSITDNVKAMNMFIQGRNNHNETCITVKVSRRKQKVVNMLANDTCGLAFCSTDLGHIFGYNVGNELAVLMIRKGPHEPEFAYGIIRIHSLIIHSDLVEYKSVGDTKAPLLRCFPFISELEGGDIITTGQYMNYQTFSNLQFRPLLKNSFHSIHIDLRDTSGEKNPLYLSVSLGLFWCLERCPPFISNTYDTTRWLFQGK